jgi:glycine/D-amino acid oxidase-like deaminating enzyme
VLIDTELGFYVRCDPLHDRSQVGRIGHAEAFEVDDPDRSRDDVERSFNEWARQVLESRLPIYRGLPEVGSKAAMLTVTPDDRALIGPVPGIEGLYVACGFNGHGLQLAPSIGEGMAQMLLGEPVSAFEPDYFAPGRFADGSSR